MKTKPYLLLIALGLLSCQLSPYFVRDYAVGIPSKATVGSVLIGWEYGYEDINGLTRDGLRIELVYTGNTASVVHVAYREYAVLTQGRFARPPFYLNLQYDLSLSKILRFKEVKIQVDSVDREYLYYRILEEPASVPSYSQQEKLVDNDQFGSNRETRLFNPPKHVTLTFRNGANREGFLFGYDSFNYAFKDSLPQLKVMLISRREVNDINYHND